MDLMMPGVDGSAATAALRAGQARARVVMLSLRDDPQSRARAQEAGAAAFVCKCDPSFVLLDAIRAAARAV